MELLIPGLILVAIMAWASTRIKRNAAAAFDAEAIETDRFSLRKPDGWLAKAEPGSGLLFEAYSKEFGKNAEENIRRGTANVSVSSSKIAEAVRTALSGASPLQDRREVVDQTHYRILEFDTEDSEASYRNVVKVGEKEGRAYTLTVTTLADATEDFRHGVEEMVDSFVLK